MPAPLDPVHLTQSLIRCQSVTPAEGGALVLLEHRTNEVRALVGNFDFWDERGGQIPGFAVARSPGSALKPFIYALALDQGLIHPMTLLKDAPRRFGAYTPENYDRGFLGPVFARDALMLSRNVPAVHLTSRLETPTLHEFLTAAGIERLQPAEIGRASCRERV